MKVRPALDRESKYKKNNCYNFCNCYTKSHLSHLLNISILCSIFLYSDSLSIGWPGKNLLMPASQPAAVYAEISQKTDRQTDSLESRDLIATTAEERKDSRGRKSQAPGKKEKERERDFPTFRKKASSVGLQIAFEKGECFRVLCSCLHRRHKRDLYGRGKKGEDFKLCVCV